MSAALSQAFVSADDRETEKMWPALSPASPAETPGRPTERGWEVRVHFSSVAAAEATTGAPHPRHRRQQKRQDERNTFAGVATGDDTETQRTRPALSPASPPETTRRPRERPRETERTRGQQFPPASAAETTGWALHLRQRRQRKRRETTWRLRETPVAEATGGPRHPRQCRRQRRQDERGNFRRRRHRRRQRDREDVAGTFAAGVVTGGDAETERTRGGKPITSVGSRGDKTSAVLSSASAAEATR